MAIKVVLNDQKYKCREVELMSSMCDVNIVGMLDHYTTDKGKVSEKYHLGNLHQHSHGVHAGNPFGAVSKAPQEQDQFYGARQEDLLLSVVQSLQLSARTVLVRYRHDASVTETSNPPIF